MQDIMTAAERQDNRAETFSTSATVKEIIYTLRSLPLLKAL